MRRSSSSRVLVHRVAAGESQHALEAVVHVDDAAVPPRHRDGVAGFVDAQEQEADLLLALGVRDGAPGNDGDARDLAGFVAYRQVRGLDPQEAACLRAVAAGARKMPAAQQPRPDLFAPDDALAFVQAVAQHVVAQGQGLCAGILHRGQEIFIGVRQKAGHVEVEQQQRPIHRRQVIARAPGGALGPRGGKAWMRIKHMGLHAG
jgi:hypothetical protein